MPGHEIVRQLVMAFDINALRVKPGTSVDLSTIDPDSTPQWSDKQSGDVSNKEAGKARVLELNERLESLQELLYAEGKHRILVVIQAMDAGGKDGTIKHVFEGVNPSGVKVAAFKAPTSNERAHDYLWRIHQHVPANGQLTIFNRSHYEDVLVVRVMDLVEKDRWKKRYDHIVNFEQMLVDEGTTIIKFFLHISKEEQGQRLQERLDRPEKNWKFDSGDLVHRERWGDYQKAFEAAIERTSTEDSPWYVIPANRKWYRNIAISEVIVQTLESLQMEFPPAPDDIAAMTIAN